MDAGLITEVDKSLVVVDRNKVKESKIIEIWGEDDETLEALSVRYRKTPIVYSASSLLKLIDCLVNLKCIYLYLVKPAEVKKFINEPLQVPQWTCCAQAIERYVFTSPGTDISARRIVCAPEVTF